MNLGIVNASVQNAFTRKGGLFLPSAPAGCIDTMSAAAAKAPPAQVQPKAGSWLCPGCGERRISANKVTCGACAPKLEHIRMRARAAATGIVIP